MAGPSGLVVPVDDPRGNGTSVVISVVVVVIVGIFLEITGALTDCATTGEVLVVTVAMGDVDLSGETSNSGTTGSFAGVGS